MDREEAFIAELQALMRKHGISYMYADDDAIAVVTQEHQRLGTYIRIHQKPEATY